MYIVIGLVGSLALIILSKLVIAPLLQRDENYYGDEND